MKTSTQPWRLAVGELFAENVTRWRDDSFELRYFNGSFMLQICENSPSAQRVRSFGKAPMHIALLFERGVLFFLFKLEGSWAWSDQAISIHRVHELDRTLKVEQRGHYVPLVVTLVNSATGIVEALRMVTMSPPFFNALQDALRQQLAAPYNTQEFERTARELYEKYPNSADMVAAASLIERAGINLTEGGVA